MSWRHKLLRKHGKHPGTDLRANAAGSRYPEGSTKTLSNGARTLLSDFLQVKVKRPLTLLAQEVWHETLGNSNDESDYKYVILI